MPLIKSAIKKMRSDVKRRSRNLAVASELKTVIKKAQTSKKFADVSAAYSALDRAVKRNLVHANFAARQKAQLSRLAKPIKLEVKVVVKKAAKKVVSKVSKKTVKKPAAKTKTPAKTVQRS